MGSGEQRSRVPWWYILTMVDVHEPQIDSILTHGLTPLFHVSIVLHLSPAMAFRRSLRISPEEKHCVIFIPRILAIRVHHHSSSTIPRPRSGACTRSSSCIPGCSKLRDYGTPVVDFPFRSHRIFRDASKGVCRYLAIFFQDHRPTAPPPDNSCTIIVVQ